jgi:CO/xanthine dehydrogenase Mo-binding subunit
MMDSRQSSYDLAIPQRYTHVRLGFKNDGALTAVHTRVVADAGVRGTARFGIAAGLRWNPFYSTKCQNLKTECEAVFGSTGRTYTSGQHWPYNWDELAVAEHVIAEKLGMDPIDVATKNIHGPASQTDNSIQPSFQLCVEQGKKAMNRQWHPAGAKKLPDGRMHGMSFRYKMCPRHATETYVCTVSVKGDGKVYIPTRGPWAGIYGADACAMVVAEEMGAKIEDVVLVYDPRGILSPEIIPIRVRFNNLPCFVEPSGHLFSCILPDFRIQSAAITGKFQRKCFRV